MLMKEFVEFELHKSMLWLSSSSYFKNFFQTQMGPQNRSKMRQRISWLANELGIVLERQLYIYQ